MAKTDEAGKRCDWCNELSNDRSVQMTPYYSKSYKRTILVALCPKCRKELEEQERLEKEKKNGKSIIGS